MRHSKLLDRTTKPLWRQIVQNLTEKVVSCVDPDVRGGDCIDIRPYVKIKIIPGGSMDETVFVDGVVFRKNVTHKRMLEPPCCPKANPRVLILASGLEFQRDGNSKLSSLDVLIEQESKFTELLVEKLMLMKPGKSAKGLSFDTLVGQLLPLWFLLLYCTLV